MQTQDVLRLSVIVPEGEPPSEFRIFKTGVTDTCYGPYLFDEISAAMVMKAFADQGNDLMVDYEHKSLDPWSPAGAGKAAAFYRIELREGECWAVNVRWTPRAAAELLDREWRYFSPAAAIDRETGRIEALINVALTNMPATVRMDPLMASRVLSATVRESAPPETTMNHVAILAMLGLGATATEKDVADEVSSLKVLSARCKEVERSLLSATGADGVDKAVGIVLGWKEGASQVPSLKARVTELEAEGDARDREALLSKHARKFTPAMKTWAATQSLDALTGFVATAPDVPGLDVAARARSTDATEEGDVGSDLDGKKWEELSPKQKHDLHFSNRRLYDALKREHEQRSSR